MKQHSALPVNVANVDKATVVNVANVANTDKINAH